jgi:hypothetical protein
MILVTKLSSGEDIISDTKIVTAGNESEPVSLCLLIKPCQVAMVATDTNSGIGIQIIPYMPYVKDHTVPLPLDCIMTQVEPSEELRNRYNSMFGSGIQLPPEKKLIMH